MSCQQVPRLAEDPYTFTETPITTTYFTSPIQKLTPIKSANQLPNQSKHLGSSVNRLNGTSNGLSSHHQTQHVPIYAKQPVYQQQRFHQNQSQTIKLAKQQLALSTAPSTEELILPAAAKTIIAKENRTKQLQLALSPSHPPLNQSIKPKQQINSNHSNATNTVSPLITTSTSISTPPPTITASTFAPIKPHPNQNNFQQNQLKLKSLGISVPQRITSKQQQNNHKTSALPIPSNQLITGETTNLKLEKCDDTIPVGINGNSVKYQTPLAPTNGVGKGKRNSNTNVKLITKPKTESKNLSGKKLSFSGKSQPIAKSKRSYSESSHHEALQRIPIRFHKLNGNAVVQKAVIPKIKREWHAPESFLFDCAAGASDLNNDQLDILSCTQAFWFRDIPNENLLTREQRLETKRDNLRRQAFQYAQAQNFRSTNLAKRRLLSITKALSKFKLERNKVTPTKCGISTCSNNALALTAYCYLHITLNTDQKLFHPCTAKFSDNSQCRVPVFDISHELPLCREHAWKRDNYNRMIQEQKPKKTVRKKAKPSAMTRPPKRNKKKKKQPNDKHEEELSSLSAVPPPLPQKHIKLSSPVDDLSWNNDIIQTSNDLHMLSKTPSITSSFNHYLTDHTTMYNYATSMPNLTKLHQQQEMFTVCENSSAYESSEDTGVGGLSESELIGAPDGIDIPLADTRLLEEHDLTNVLNQLPEDAFNELFEVQQHDHYEPTQKEQDELARALEEVDEQVKSLKQMTGSTDLFENFLDVDDEILVDGSDMCTDVLTTSLVKQEIRGLVHT